MGLTKKRALFRAKKAGIVCGGVQKKKGPCGTGQRRKQETRERKRSAQDRHEQLSEFHEKQQKKLKHLALVSGNADKGKNDNNATGFDKALAMQGQSSAVAAAFQRNHWLGDEPKPGEPDDVLKQQRREIGVKFRGAPAPAPVSSFTDPALPRPFHDFFNARRGIGRIGQRIEKPTPIQAQCWPAALCGLDVIGIAPTGSGKTLAYLLPALPHVLAQEKERLQQRAPSSTSQSPFVLTLLPTRELAQQVCDVLGGSSGGSGGWIKRLFALRAGVVYGGAGKEEQVDNIVTHGAPHILSATPGRLLDLMGLGVLSLDKVTYLVLDEADRMLALGFEPQLTAIMKAVRPNRQVLLFTATFPGKLREAAEEWMGDARVTIRVGAIETDDHRAIKNSTKNDDGQADSKSKVDDEEDAGTVALEGDTEGSTKTTPPSSSSTLTVSATVEQTVHVCAVHKKAAKLLKFITQVRKKEKETNVRQRAAILVFCGQIKVLRTVAALLEKHGERSAPLHSGIPQAKREAALADLKVGRIDTVIATDLASRGLHISRLKYVVNYDFPSNLESYCHRIGRVGRNGAEGWAYSFLHRGLAPLAAGMIDILERCKQKVDPNLKLLAKEYAENKDKATSDTKEEEDKYDDNESSVDSEAGDADKGDGAGAGPVKKVDDYESSVDSEAGDADKGHGAGAGQVKKDDAMRDDDDELEIAPPMASSGGGISFMPKRKKRGRVDDSDASSDETGCEVEAKPGTGKKGGGKKGGGKKGGGKKGGGKKGGDQGDGGKGSGNVKKRERGKRGGAKHRA